MIPPHDFVWIEPWKPITDEAVASALLKELARELCPKHHLFQRVTNALARRVDCDDVLFSTTDPERPLAVVHLTWRGQEEPDPIWPITELFVEWNEFQAASRQ